MPRPTLTQDRLVLALEGGVPMSHREFIAATGLSQSSVWNGLRRCWDSGRVLRTKSALFETERVFRGRAGSVETTRPYHLYLLRPEGIDSLVVDGVEFVAFDERYLDPRGGGSKSKASRIRDFIEEHLVRRSIVLRLLRL